MGSNHPSYYSDDRSDRLRPGTRPNSCVHRPGDFRTEHFAAPPLPAQLFRDVSSASAASAELPDPILALGSASALAAASMHSKPVTEGG